MKNARSLLLCLVALAGCAAIDEQVYPGVTANSASPTVKAAGPSPHSGVDTEVLVGP